MNKQPYDPYSKPQQQDPYGTHQAPPPKKKRKWWLIIILVFVVGAFINAAIGASDNESEDSDPGISKKIEKTQAITTIAESETQSETATIDYEEIQYDEITRNPSSFEGKKVKVTGEVSQYVEGGLLTATFFAIYDNYDNQWMILMEQPEENRLIKGDQVTFYGTFNGLSNVKTILGEKKQVPSIEGTHFQLLNPIEIE